MVMKIDQRIKSLLDSLSWETRQEIYQHCYEQERLSQQRELEKGERLHVDTALSVKLTPPGRDKDLTLQTINNYNRGKTVPSGEILLQALALLPFSKVEDLILEDIHRSLRALYRHMIAERNFTNSVEKTRFPTGSKYSEIGGYLAWDEPVPVLHILRMGWGREEHYDDE